MSATLTKAEAKRAARQQERERTRPGRERRRRELRCFWTWPLGHAYVAVSSDNDGFSGGMGGDWHCIKCGKDIPAAP